MLIGLLDQFHFPVSLPALQAAFHLRRLGHRLEALKPDERATLILCGEARPDTLFMLTNAYGQV